MNLFYVPSLVIESWSIYRSGDATKQSHLARNCIMMNYQLIKPLMDINYFRRVTVWYELKLYYLCKSPCIGVVRHQVISPSNITVERAPLTHHLTKKVAEPAICAEKLPMCTQAYRLCNPWTLIPQLPCRIRECMADTSHLCTRICPLTYDPLFDRLYH